MSGNLEEIPLPDLMQLFGTSKKSGVLEIEAEFGIGRIFLSDGLVHQAEILRPEDEEAGLTGLKAVYRMITWPSGLFVLNPPDPRTFESPLDTNVQEVLMEGFRQKDEFEQMRHRLPEEGATLTLSTPLTAPLRDLVAKELDVLQAAINAETVGATLDESQLSDLETGAALIKLIDRGYIVAS
jgi:hypothetical protein